MQQSLRSPQLGARTTRPSVGGRKSQVCRAAIDKAQLKAAYNELKEYITSKSCNPIIVRLAWHDSGTYDASIKEWPACGGATASIRLEPELSHGANKGLKIAVALMKPMKAKYPNVSFSDLYQMGSAAAIEAAGGPIIPMRYGRRDVESSEQCAKEGNLPDAAHPFSDGSKSPAEHLRRVFNRMGLNDQEIVVLSGGHTLGRSKPDRSGHGKPSTPYTEPGGTPNFGKSTPGGQSWTPDWLVFNNSYFTENLKKHLDPELLRLETDSVLFGDEGFRPYAERYAADQDVFFKEYAVAHQKLSELGVQWVEGGPVTI